MKSRKKRLREVYVLGVACTYLPLGECIVHRHTLHYRVYHCCTLRPCRMLQKPISAIGSAWSVSSTL